MKTFFPIKLLTFGLLFCAITSFAQKCDCDSLLNARMLQAMKRVKNYDSFKFISILKKGVIKTIAEKENIIRILTSDSAWVPLSDHGDSITVKLFRLDSVQGRKITFLDGAIDDIDSAKFASLTREQTLRIVQTNFGQKATMINYFYENIHLNDEYFELCLNVEGKVVMAPTVCAKSNCNSTDNIITYFLYLL